LIASFEERQGAIFFKKPVNIMNIIFNDAHIVKGDNNILYYNKADQIICGIEGSNKCILLGLKVIERYCTLLQVFLIFFVETCVIY